MRIIVIESGSKGNATLLIEKDRILLIDMGISISKLNEVLLSVNKNLYNIDGLLLTHEHCDHTKGIRYLPPLPTFTTKGTYEGSNVVEVIPYKKFKIGEFEIRPIKTSHDVVNPIGFVITTKKEKLVYVTDTGMLTKKSLNYLKNADYYVFESNHDVEMLMNTKRPYLLKKRILSNKGHLSNEQSANYMCELIGERTKKIVLAHLSEEANSPDVALETYKRIFKSRKISLKGIKLYCANQHQSVEI